ncbi:hypothetical protein RN001_007801 [Aquatica leii]|uniref:DDE Tnp4 domain-containing protein n=1 Tax=Aquatica leii TaxID=1421715 RepID=A0AAN7P3D8_9COLE|nr:hypothetical protein RN001_007801 [Aquatica leii]
MSVVDANYKFIYANVGTNVRISDGGMFEACNLFKRLKNNSLQLPESSYLPGLKLPLSYVFIADVAFPFIENLMKLFSQRALNEESLVYNYRLSSARRMVENGFGILANRWRVLLTPIHLSPEKVELTTLACLALHSFWHFKIPLTSGKTQKPI